jgi:uncharacterized membrane protein
MKSFYQQAFLALNTPMTMRIMVGLLTWACIVGGSLYFVMPTLENSFFQAFFQGAVYGLVLYSVYDLTNLSIFQHWSIPMTIIDIAWGTILNGLLACLLLVLKNSL